MNYWNYKIFLTEDGEIDKADRIYYDIDNFAKDISFLSNDLPRLNVTLRKLLSTNYDTWESNKGHFKAFNDYIFVKISLIISRSMKKCFLQKRIVSISYIFFL